MKHKFIYILLIITALSSSDVLFSQTDLDSKGRDFWLTFFPNFHNNKYDTDPKKRFTDSLNIYIAAETATSGVITYRNIDGDVFVHNFTISDTNDIYRFKLHYRGFELDGFNDHGRFWGKYQTEEPAPQTFHIEADDDITVYALNQALYTSDAFLIFPTDVLGEDYYILSYNADGTIGGDLSRTPSQFAIVATEDNTEIDINLKTPSYINGIKPQHITLNKGDAYLVQSAFDLGDQNPDLTGSSIKANKPIAVFSGHQRSKIPVNQKSSNASRDILVEQLQPYKNWGRNAFIIPLVQPYNISIDGNDLFRIVAAKDSTDIYLNKEYITTINSGEFFEAPADKMFIIQSNNPISVAQYKKTSKFWGGQLNISDPYMLVIPPKEQYLNSYRIINAESWDYGSSGQGYIKSFTEQYITLIVPDTALNTVVIDNKQISASKFRVIPNSGYSYLNFATIAGVHSVYASAPFGIYISGFGTANSYGYLGGMSFTPLNFRAPRILGNDSCHTVYGKFERYSKTDFGLWETTVTDSSNVNVTVSPFIPNDDTVYFRGELIDYRLDGNFTIISWDSLGNNAEKSYEIPGYTIGLENDNLPANLPVFNMTLRTNIKSEGSLNLENYGKFNQITSNIYFQKPHFVVISDPVINFNPGDVKTITYQFIFEDYLNHDTLIIDTLWISDACTDRPIAIMEYLIIGDKNIPEVESFHSDCDTMTTVVFTEIMENDYGIKSLEIVDKANCVIDIISLSYRRAEIEIRQIMKNYDAFFTIVVTDSANNQHIYRDTIRGNNIFIDQIAGGKDFYSFGERVIGYLSCDSLNIRNNGPTELRIERIRLSKNVFFSIPQAQLPFIVAPGEVKALFVCLKTNAVRKDRYRDTLTINLDCIERKIALDVQATELIRTGFSQCDAAMKLVTQEVPKDFFIDNIYPNPLSNRGMINIGIPQKDLIYIRVFDVLGNDVLDISQLEVDYGLYEISFDTSSLRQGVYFIVITYNNRSYSREFRKIK